MCRLERVQSPQGRDLLVAAPPGGPARYFWIPVGAQTKEMSMQEIPKGFEPGTIEEKWFRAWDQAGLFAGDPLSPRPPYSMVIPPPNVTGSLHMGHALNNTLQDVLARWRRMSGDNTLWVVGTDHAGIGAQNVVERKLAEQNVRREDLGRERFEAEVWKWKETYEARILSQLKKLGCSCDWSRPRFTMDEGLSRAVREVFVRLYEDELLYRGEYMVNWCPRCTTAISDLEVIHTSKNGKLYYLRYPFSDGSGHVVVATTRPETMLGDVAVAVHPSDLRYLDLHGRTVVLPLVDRSLPVILDEFVDQTFGTGVVKITPAHDSNDYEVGRRHGLVLCRVLDNHGKMTAETGRFAGLDRFAARKQILAALDAQGLIERIEDHVHSIGHCQRCETVVEPMVSTQWFIRIQPLADEAIRVVEEGRIEFVPANYKKIYLNWMYNIHDWCVSRQLWWGHRIPAWHCRDCSQMTVARQDPQRCQHCGSQRIDQDSDVLDTWFSSALWPFSTLGWPDETPELKTFYPTSALVTGSDIIFFWVARMIMMGQRFMKDVPFRRVHMTGLVRDERKQKMSKSKGNVIDPLEIIDEFGTDAVRFTLAVLAAPGTDIPFSTDRMMGYRNFVNKIWNVGRFFLMNIGDEQSPVAENAVANLLDDHKTLGLVNRWILHRLHEVIENLDGNLAQFRFHEAANQLYHFFWHELCDWYIELIKPVLARDVADPERQKTAQILVYVFDQSLRLLHPFMPFITEELWQRLPHEGEFLAAASFPRRQPMFDDPAAVAQMGALMDLITQIRTSRSESNVNPGVRLSAELIVSGEASAAFNDGKDYVLLLAKLDRLEVVSAFATQGRSVKGISQLGEFLLSLDGAVDRTAEVERLEREIVRLRPEVVKLNAKLQNESFVGNAPPEVVAATRNRFAEMSDRLQKLEKAIAAAND
ncbi:MAG: valine--tRNA ligase [Acidobacteriota bacterium]